MSDAKIQTIYRVHVHLELVSLWHNGGSPEPSLTIQRFYRVQVFIFWLRISTWNPTKKDPNEDKFIYWWEMTPGKKIHWSDEWSWAFGIEIQKHWRRQGDVVRSRLWSLNLRLPHVSRLIAPERKHCQQSYVKGSRNDGRMIIIICLLLNCLQLIVWEERGDSAVNSGGGLARQKPKPSSSSNFDFDKPYSTGLAKFAN